MAGMTMDECVDLMHAAPGVWQGTGRLSMAGNWSLVAEVDGESLSLPFRAMGF